MAGVTALAVDLLTGRVRDELLLTTVTWSTTLNRPGALNATVPATDPKATPRNLDVGRTVLYVQTAGGLTPGYVLWDVEWAADGMLRLAGEGLWSVLRDGRRSIRNGASYTAVDQFAIVADLIAEAQAGPSESVWLSVVPHPSGHSGVLRDRTYPAHERKAVAEAVEQLAEVEDGFDLTFLGSWDGSRPRTTMHLWYPAAGGLTPWVLEHGHNAQVTRWQRSARRLANRADAIGAGDGNSTLIATASAAPDPYPRLDVTVTYKDVTVPATLAEHAELARIRNRLPLETLTMRVDDHPNAPTGALTIGDHVLVECRDGYLELTGRRRITTITRAADVDGDETVTVDLSSPVRGGPVLAGLALDEAHRRDLERRLTTLERR